MATTVGSWDTLLEGEELAHLTTEPAVDARLAPLPEDLHPRVHQALAARGITGLFTHQAETFATARSGRHVLVATGTASGKTLAFNLPVLDALVADPKLRALYIYPTKALAQDQARSLAELGVPNVRTAIYDGDTEPERRRQIRKWANLILTNPDMLSVGVLPHHDRWGDVLASLRYVVVDEAHVYRGVFGSHVANVLRRLRRLAAVYGSEPQFLLASATIGNPAELADELIGEEVFVVDTDAARRAERTIALWNPPLIDPELGLRGSALAEASRLLAGLVERDLRTICFTKSRKAAELVHRFACARLGREQASRLSPYRAGYTPAQRREIERRLVEGELLGVTATDALELGIDIGMLDCAISVGFPGTVASLRQQWGRAGRREAGLAVLVASEDALDQFFMREPAALLSRRVEAAILDHANPRVLDGHVRAAAFEAPLSEDDASSLGPEALERAEVLAERGELARTPAGYGWAGRDYPAGRLSLRSTGGAAVAVVDTASGQVLGSVDENRAPSTVHEGAIYLHLGESFRVLSLDLTARAALVEPFSGDYYTQTKRETLTTIEEEQRSERRLGVELRFGQVSVTEQVIAYQKRSIRTQEAFDLVALDLPPNTFDTEAIWFCPEEWMLEEVGHATRPDRAAAMQGRSPRSGRAAGAKPRSPSGAAPAEPVPRKRPEAAVTQLERTPRLLGTLHAAEHSLIALLPLWAMCDRWDIGGLSTNVHPQTGRPTIFVYDGHPGGVGITERGFDRFEGWAGNTAAMLAGCPCERGCPSCVQSPKCGNLNEPLDKEGALALLRRMLDGAS
jgi:DEAD/DEAH box helicase domain-containing protein